MKWICGVIYGEIILNPEGYDEFKDGAKHIREHYQQKNRNIDKACSGFSSA